MQLQGRNLRAGVAGDDVATLHEHLGALGFDIPENERRERAFGVGTAAAVAAFQQAHGLLDTAMVDAATAASLGRAVADVASETVTMSVPRPPGGADQRPVQEGDTAPMTPPAAEPDGSLEATIVHRALEAIGVEVAEEEREHGRIGASTREAVARMQALVGLAPTGHVDSTTLAMARAALGRLGDREPGGRVTPGEGEWVVAGPVSDGNGLPMAGATVVALTRDLRETTEVGRATTDRTGRYLIRYTGADGPPDLQLEVRDAAGTTLFRSPVQHRVERHAEVALALGGGRSAVPTEYTALASAVGRRLGRLRPEELVEDGQHKDVSFLAGDTGHARESVAFYAVAARLARTTDLPADLFYALFRQNVPASAGAAALAASSAGVDLDRNADRLLAAVLAASPEARATAVRAAIASQMIAPDYAERAEADLARLTGLGASAALREAHGMGKTPIATVLTAAGVAPEKQERFVAALIAADRPTSRFWRGLADNDSFTRDEVATIRFATDVGRATRGHVPLVEALLDLRRAGRVGGTRDLARLTAADWRNLVSSHRGGQPIGIPANLTAANEEQAVGAYAYLLERQFERMHPTAAFSARLAADPTSPLPGKDTVAWFLDNNPTFSLRRTNVDRYLVDNPGSVGGSDRAVLRESLLVSQRMVKLTDRYAVTRPLLADGIQSAQQIYAMGRSGFVGAYAEHPDIGSTQAARVYGLAEQVYAWSLSLMMNLHAPLVGLDFKAIAPPKMAPMPGGPLLPSPGGPAAPAPAPGGTPAPAPAPGGEVPMLPAIGDLPNLQTLFGSLDLCACQHCRSVLSPAAYLVDMLQFLRQRKAKSGTLRDVLLARRPDLAQIELTCPNTNSVLPYVDLVNELLEDAVAPPADPVAAARARQTTLTTDELNANPEHVNQAAYTALATAVFPWRLPFDLPLAEARTYLGLLGTDRVRLARTFGAPAEPGSAHAVAMAIEGLGLSAVEADIITGGPLAAANTSWDYWGLAETGNTVPDPVDHAVGYTGTWLGVLAHVRVLLDRAGLSYQALTELLNTVFVNPGGAVTVQCHPEDSCDIGAMTIQGLTADVADRLHRFVRLQRRLGWSVYETDSAVALLQAGTPNGLGRLNVLLLRQLFAVRTAVKRFGIPVAAAVALLARIETRDVPPLPGEERPRHSLYRELFQNRMVLNPVDEDFALDATGTEIAIVASAPTLAGHRDTLVAALEISDADLMLAVDGLTDGLLTLANLSTVYRAVTLARGLGVPVADLLSLLRLVEREVPASPGYEVVDPFDLTRPELLDAFCAEVDQIRQTRFSVATLDYLLRQKIEPTSAIAPDVLAVGTLLKSVRDKLVKLAAEQPAGPYEQLGMGLVVQELAEALTLPTATVADMVIGWLPAQGNPADPLVTEWLALPTVVRSPSAQDQSVDPAEPGFAVYFAGFAALAKLAAVVTTFGFSTEEAAWVRVHGSPAGWLDPAALPLVESATSQGRYARWRRLADAAALKTSLPSDGTPVTSLLDLALGGASKADHMAALRARTQWSAETLTTLAGDPANPADTGLLALAYPADYTSERALRRLADAFAVLRRLGISADVGGWIGPIVTADQADAIKQSVKAKYTTQRWGAVAKSLRDVLREQQRDALVGYLLAHPPTGVTRWHDASDLYARYLIDVEMGACQGTSRIVQANATIQLFVQRCILNLEPAVVVDADEDPEWLQWKWMSRYRVWEANRKVFCYPENWIQPELRRDKSPFYQELERELLQSEVTKETAEEALRNYLTKLAAVARLDVVGLFHENRDDENATTLHVFARKHGHPPTYYYRQWIDSSRWTAWTKVEIDIDSDHVLPIVWNRRLYLFWAVANHKPDRTQQNPTMEMSSSSPSGAKTHLEVTLAWSELKGDKWLPTQTAPQTLVFPDDVDPHEIMLKSSLADPLLRIDVFTLYGYSQVHAAQYILGGVGNGVDAYVSSSSGLTKVGPQARGIGLFGTGMNKGTLFPPTNSKFDSGAIVPVTFAYKSAARPRVTDLNTTYDLYGVLTSEPVLNKADRYRLIVAHQQLWFDSTLPFFYADSRRSYFVVPTMYYRNGHYFTTTTPASVYQPVFKPKYTFWPNYHAYVGLFIRELSGGGIDRLYRRELQLDPASVQAGKATAPFSFNVYYEPNGNVLQKYPTEGVDFERHAGYAIYNWELFFHVPFAIGDALRRNQRFEEAKRWFEYVFDPTSASKDAVPQRYWVTKPFYKMTALDYWQQRIENLMKLINIGDDAAEEQVIQWRRNPFEPHIIAGLRPVAYQRAIVMRYIDNLIEWGDQLFRQDTMESVNEATQLYVLAAELLGPRPEIVPRNDEAAPMTYADMADSLDSFSNVVAAAENALPPVQVDAPVDPSIPKLPILPSLYFCIPPNEQLLGYWDRVADRLFKVRHCMNIEGVVRQLALFAPPIDPGLLVKAAAAGLDLGSVLNETSAPLPPYRFRIILRQAVELARTVQALGADLLACLQLRDADKLDLLRAGAERKLQDQVRAVQQKMIDEAAQQIEVLDANRAVVKLRQDYYGGLTDQLMNAWEITSMALTAASVVAQGVALALESTSGAAHAVVDLQFGGSGAGGSPHATVKFGGENVGKAAAGWARVAKVAAAVLQTGAQMASITAQYQRRKEDWQFQHDLAGKDLATIDAQVVAANIRKELATLNKTNHETVATAAADVDAFLHSKFTNTELYDWMIAQVSTTYFQAYQLAYTVAKRAERCFRRELGLRDSSYVQFGYWDSLKKGLHAADKLLFDLHRMEAAYLAQHERELELTKHISLVQIDPYALVQLRTTGECTISLPELLFDLDNPGHYQRTIKSVGVTVPCVVGPYTGVPLTLTLLDNHYRDSTNTSPQYARQSGDDIRFVDDMGGLQAIVTSGAQNDPGMFERRMEDDRYLPFEGAGAISTWKLRLNPVYPQFDYRTISDVVLHLHYTARDGGATLAAAAAASAKSSLNSIALAESRSGLYRLVSARQEHGTAWHKFLNPGTGQDQVLTVDTPPEAFAFFTNGMDIKVTGIDVLAKLADSGDYTLVVIRPGASAQTVTMQTDPLLGGLHRWSADPLAPKASIGRAPASLPYPQWTFKLQKAGATDFRSLEPDEIDDLVLVLRYEVTP